MTEYCAAVLRPEGIACTLLAGHEPYTSPDHWTTDHCNVVGQWSDGRPTREGGPAEWGFNNPIGRKLDDEATGPAAAAALRDAARVITRAGADFTQDYEIKSLCPEVVGGPNVPVGVGEYLMRRADEIQAGGPLEAMT